MRSQQQAERAEQQRIKSLVLNYDLGDDYQHDGTEDPAFRYVYSPRSKRNRLVGKGALNESLPSKTNMRVHGGRGGQDGQSQRSPSPASTYATIAKENGDSLSPLTSSLNDKLQTRQTTR